PLGTLHIDTGGFDSNPDTETLIIPQSLLSMLAADGTISITATPNIEVQNFGPTELTLTLEYPAASGVLEIQDSSGVVVASASGDADNLSLFIENFVAPADDTYYVRVADVKDYSLVVTRDANFDAEPNNSANEAQSITGTDGLLGTLGGAGVDLSLLKDFDGLGQSESGGFIPPDPIIAAGPDNVITMVNTAIAIQDKTTGAFIDSISTNFATGFWGSVGATGVVFDPWIVFDPDSERFIAMAVEIPSSSQSFIYLAISKTDNPTTLSPSDWHLYQLDRTGSGPSGPTFPDYPKLGVDGDAIYITANDFPILGGPSSFVSLFAVEKAPLLTGGPANVIYDEAITSAFSVHPVVVYEPEPAMYFAEAVGSTGIRLHALTDVLGTPTRTTSTITVPTFFFPQDVPQLGGPALDSVSQRIMSGVVRDGSLWTAHAVDDPADSETKAVARWYEFDVTNFPATSSPTLVQTGNVDPGPGIHAWMTHVNVDAAGNMAIGFSLAGPSLFGGAGYTARLATDPLGTTQGVEILIDGQGPYSQIDGSGRNRWGDYTGLAVDPDGKTFWVYNEYATSSGTWDTRIGAFQINPEPGFDFVEVTTTAEEPAIFIQTSLPAGGPGEFVNALNPKIDIFDSTGTTLLASGVEFDGRNEFISFVGDAAGATYVIRVSSEDETTGEYFLGVVPVQVETLGVEADTPFTFDLLGENVELIDIDDVTPARPTLIDNGDGTLSYAPNGQFAYLAAGESATDLFYYKTLDTNGVEATVLVTVTINGPTDLNNSGTSFQFSQDTNGGANRFGFDGDAFFISGQGVSGKPEFQDFDDFLVKAAEVFDGVIEKSGNINDQRLPLGEGPNNISVNDNDEVVISGRGIGGFYQIQFSGTGPAYTFRDFVVRMFDQIDENDAVANDPKDFRFDGGDLRLFYDDVNDQFGFTNDGGGTQSRFNTLEAFVYALSAQFGGVKLRSGTLNAVRIAQGKLPNQIRTTASGKLIISGQSVSGRMEFAFDNEETALLVADIFRTLFKDIDEADAIANGDL
ncbi:MAG: hypothetical protein ACFCD0_27190, partial [Gemmataceae bacterium]